MIQDIESKLNAVFNTNPLFNKENIKDDNSFAARIKNYVAKLFKSFQEFEGYDANKLANNLCDKLQTFDLRPLSIYSNNGFIDYDPNENIGYISLIALRDEANDFNIDNLMTQILLMVSTSKDSYYGFGNEEVLCSLNRACTYIIASYLSGTAKKCFLEEELLTLNLLDIRLRGSNNKLGFIEAYFTNNGSFLKNELNQAGITDDLLNELNYLSQAKMSKLEMPDLYARIQNKINRNFAMAVANGVITDPQIVSSYKANLVNDEVLEYSNFGLSKNIINMSKALETIEQRKQIVNNDKGMVMSKVA